MKPLSPSLSAWSRSIGRELASSVVVASLAAAAFSGLGLAATSVVTALAPWSASMPLDRVMYAVGIPVFFAAWIGWGARRFVLRSRGHAALCTLALGALTALATRLILVGEVERAFMSDESCVARADAVLGTVCESFGALDAWQRAFAFFGGELAWFGSLWWGSVAAVALAVAGVDVLARSAQRIRALTLLDRPASPA